jgi:hypothetical protein
MSMYLMRGKTEKAVTLSDRKATITVKPLDTFRLGRQNEILFLLKDGIKVAVDKPTADKLIAESEVLQVSAVHKMRRHLVQSLRPKVEGLLHRHLEGFTYGFRDGQVFAYRMYEKGELVKSQQVYVVFQFGSNVVGFTCYCKKEIQGFESRPQVVKFIALTKLLHTLLASDVTANRVTVTRSKLGGSRLPTGQLFSGETHGCLFSWEP